MGKRTVRRRRPHADNDKSVLHYFFLNGNPTHPRTDPVRRDELWGALEWFQRRVIRENRWYRRLWRSLRTRLPTSRLNPFVWIRMQQEEKPDER